MLSSTSKRITVGLFLACVGVSAAVYYTTSIKPEASSELTTVNETTSSFLDTNESLNLARAMASEQNFEQALKILNRIPPENKNGYDVKFLEARIMAWSGEHVSAEEKFVNLREEYPQDPDIKVAFGYLNYYQKDFVQAEQLFTEVLVDHPDYQDAQKGLNRVQAARGW